MRTKILLYPKTLSQMLVATLPTKDASAGESCSSDFVAVAEQDGHILYASLIKKGTSSNHRPCKYEIHVSKDDKDCCKKCCPEFSEEALTMLLADVMAGL